MVGCKTEQGRSGVNLFLMEQIEVWKQVIGYEGQYEVSNMGRLRYVPKTVMVFRKDTSRSHAVSIKGKTSNGAANSKGYVYVKLQRDRKRQSVKMHRLVALHFIPNPNNLPQVNHIDGDKKNNKAVNLEWCNNSHNIKHAYSSGLMNRKGERQNTCKIKESDVLEIREFYSKNPKSFLRVYAEKLNITITTVSNIIKRNIWKHI